jgi:hypothetical protein
MSLQASRVKFNDKSEPRTTGLITGGLSLHNKYSSGFYFLKFSVPCILVDTSEMYYLNAHIFKCNNIFTTLLLHVSVCYILSSGRATRISPQSHVLFT